MDDAAKTVAYVTGASRGLGRLFTEALAADGATVAAFARPSADLKALSSVSQNVVPIAMDVTDRSSVITAFTQATNYIGAPTSLVCCAGSMGGLGPVATVDAETWWDAVTVDLRGTMLCAQAALSTMIDAATGQIITVYGNLGDDGRPNVSAFAAAKAAVARFTETLSSELEGTGVSTICLHPGFVRTSMTEHLATSTEGQRWLPDFGTRAEQHWGDGADAVETLRRIVAGDADPVAGQIVHAGNSLEQRQRLAVSEPS